MKRNIIDFSRIYHSNNYGDFKIIKEVNKDLTSYKAIKKLEIKKDDFEMTTTLKIKRYKELEKK